MAEDERVWAVKELLFSYVRSPSLRHIRDPYSVSKQAGEIVKKLDREAHPGRSGTHSASFCLSPPLRAGYPLRTCAFSSTEWTVHP